MRSRIIATIGPASDHVETLAEMMQAGMNIARLNYSHGDFEGKEQTVRNIRQAELQEGEKEREMKSRSRAFNTALNVVGGLGT